jgi:hypothetical protein
MRTKEDIMFELIALIAAGAASVTGYVKSRDFVQRRLRYVDAVQKRRTPWVAGTVATLAAAPVVTLLPIVGAGTAIAFGVAVGVGTRAGANRIRSDDSRYPRWAS